MYQKRSRSSSSTKGIMIAKISHLTTICLCIKTKEAAKHINSKIPMSGILPLLQKTHKRSLNLIGVKASADHNSLKSGLRKVQQVEIHRLEQLVAHQPTTQRPVRVVHQQIETTISHGNNLRRRRKSLPHSWSITTQTVLALTSN